MSVVLRLDDGLMRGHRTLISMTLEYTAAPNSKQEPRDNRISKQHAANKMKAQRSVLHGGDTFSCMHGKGQGFLHAALIGPDTRLPMTQISHEGLIKMMVAADLGSLYRLTTEQFAFSFFPKYDP